jgi:hypothetical protein
MRVTTWAVLGSLVINLGLGLAVAAVFSVSPPAHAAESSHCAAGHAVHSTRPSDRPVLVHRAYVVAARMGWAAG